MTRSKTRYGKNQAGFRMLLARRLVESGVRLVTLTYGGWDMHDRIKDNIKRQVPSLDQALATLIHRSFGARTSRFSTLVMVSFRIRTDSQDQQDRWPRSLAPGFLNGSRRWWYQGRNGLRIFRFTRRGARRESSGRPGFRKNCVSSAWESMRTRN